MSPKTRKTVRKADIIAKKQILHKELLDLLASSDRYRKKRMSKRI